MIFPHLEYINRLQTELTVINRHHNEIRAVGRALSEMCVPRQEIHNIIQLHQDTVKTAQHMLSVFRTSHYTRTIEDEEECTTRGGDIRLLFGDIY